MPTRCSPSFAPALRTVVLVVLVGAPPAQDPTPTPQPEPPAAAARPFLWRIDGEVPCWLFGTFHVPDERITDLPPVVEQAFAGVDAVFTEIDMDTALSPELLKSFAMPAGKTLRDVTPPETLAQLRKRLGGEAAITAVQGMRPWAVSMQVMVGTRRTGTPLDMMLWKDAKSAGKEIGGLETIQEQLAAFDAFGLEGDVSLLRDTLDLLDDYEKRGLDATEEMIRAWCAGDTERTLGFFDEMSGRGVWKRLSRTLLVDRNFRMAERIDRKLHDAPKKKFAFAVGTGHLIGESSVVDLLRARGYVVTRVPESLANVDEEIGQLEREVRARRARIDQLLEKRAALTHTPQKKAG